MSLQVFSNPITLASLTLVQLGVSMAANLGGLDDVPAQDTATANDSGKEETKDNAEATATAPEKDTAAKDTATAEKPTAQTKAAETTGDTATDKTVWWTPATPTTATATTANKAASQTDTKADSKTTGATSSGKYNQFGFIGSQSVWQASTLASSVSGSLSVASIQNKTSGANAVRGYVIPDRDATFQKAVLVGGFVGISLLLQAL